jgi:hypothetical protein
MHWCAPGEIDRDAAQAGFAVRLRTTSKRMLTHPTSMTSKKTFWQGWLVYVLAAVSR